MSPMCVGQDPRRSSAAFADACLSCSRAVCCGPVGLISSSMRCTGSLVKPSA